MAPAGPLHRTPHRLGRGLRGCRISQAVIKNHDDIGTESNLEFHCSFRGELIRGAIQMGLERHPIFADLSKPAQAEHLITAAICQDWPVPFHEAVQSTESCDRLLSRSKHQVIRVAEKDLDRKRLQLLRRQTFYRS